MSHLLLITNSFPVSGYTEDAFIWPELNALHRHFDSITIIPNHIDKEHLKQDIEENELFSVDSEYILTGRSKSTLYLLKYLFHKHVIKAIIKDRKSITSRLKLYSLLAFYHNAYSFKQWLKHKYFTKQHPEYVIYTFWFHANTTGVALLPSNIDVKCITRAHRYDIFDDQVVYRSHYFRDLTLSKIKSVFVCSKDGSNYIKRGFPQFSNKIKVSYLGSTKLYGGLSNTSDNLNEMTFLSCSRCHPVKRISLIYKFLSHLSSCYPNIKIQWIHVGDGEELEIVEKAVKEWCPINFHPQLIGAMANTDVQKLYLKQPVDWFITLSSSEGLPISICESLSYGVPVIATAVGGIPEIINDKVGILLQEPTEIETFIENISKYISSKEAYMELRKNAATQWAAYFNAKILRETFAREISQMS